jgi:uridine phosphorylase
MKTAWYLRLSEAEVSRSAILVGDRSRVQLIASFMQDVKVLNEDRGLLTVTGMFNGEKIVVVSFGMGAPIAAVVAHELINLGVTQILRLGTTMNLGPSKLGDFVLADSAIARDGTSRSYIQGKTTFLASTSLNESIAQTLEDQAITTRRGCVVSADGFYTEMMSLDDEDSFRVASKHKEFEELGCIGLDMESAVLFAIGERLGVETSSLCIATVSAHTKEKLAEQLRSDAEKKLSLVGLQSLTKGR